jgi:MraZ protein
VLRGNSPAKVDEKGRVKIPATFLDSLKESGDRFYVTSTNGEFARVYPMSVWTGIEDKLSKLSSHNKTKQKFLMHTNYFGQVVELDAQGRLLIPSVLREAAQMKGDVDVLGNLTYLDIWNHVKYLESMKQSPITDDDEKVLDELGI